MKNSYTYAGYAALVAALICVSPAQSAETRISCDQSDNLDATMAARYIHTPSRALFDVSFKAPVSTGFEVREVLEVRVDGYAVGYARLELRGGGRIGASLTFDSYSNAGLADNPAVSAFPADWPGSLPPLATGLRSGSRIMIGNLGCTLK